MKITVTRTPLPGVLLVDTPYNRDSRGFFLEAWHERDYAEAGLALRFVQENHSGSERGVLRGLHYQDLSAPLAKLVRCRFKTAALEQWGVRREYLHRLKNAFDARGIEIPYPHLTVYAGQDKQGSAPEFRLLARRGRPQAP